jgi:Undecaprenyl-phosphate glucose phosphotransferase
MTDVTHAASSRGELAAPVPLILGRSLAFFWPAADALVIIALAQLAGVAYHLAVYHAAGHIADYAKVGAIIALLRWILQQPVLGITAHSKGSLRYQFYLWTAAFLCMLAFSFVVKISGTYSRGFVLLFYVIGLPLLMIWQHGWKSAVRHGLKTGRLAVRRGVLLGTAAKIDEFRTKYDPRRSGMIVSDTVVIPEEALEDTSRGNARLEAALAQAVATVRHSHPDDIVLLLPWSATHAVNSCADRLMTIPVSVRLGPETIFDRFSEIHLSRLGPAIMLNLLRPPLTRIEVLSKRCLDFGLALGLLAATSPVLLLAAAMIKLDSRGPVFFRQWRHGFNQKPFKIIKLRTMHVSEDGPLVQQATRDDPRVTRIGSYLRRWNIDELPQLLNVLLGDMSLVGPRPHALTHDFEYERKIAFYARRHNIKPGITGWAQVNGYRGETDTEDKMRARVEHDLYYIDNWSVPFDLYILALTALSPKSFRNAY